MSRDDDAVWRALADPTRRALLDLLRSGPRTTGDLCAAFGTTRFAVMKHLGVLHEAGLIVVRRRGRERWNALNAVPLRRLYDRWAGRWADQHAASLLNLRTVSETRKGEPPMDVRLVAIEQDIEINAPAEHVWKILTEDVGRWWLHHFWDGGSPFLELRAGGVFGERCGSNEVLGAVVTRVEPPHRLCMRGPMGMEGAVAGAIDYRLEARDGGTVLSLSHHVLGEIDEETEAGYRRGWHALLHDAIAPLCEGREIARTA